MIQKLILGDCLKEMELMSDGVFDIIVTSPPYDDLRTYNGNINQWNEEKWRKIIKNSLRILKNGGVMIWIVSDETANGSETGTSFKQALWAKECGFNIHDTMIWNKENFTAVGSLKTRYAPVFEYMFVFSKGKPKTFNPIKDRINKSSGRKRSGSIRTKNGKTKPLSNYSRDIPKYGQRHNVWNMPPEMSETKRFHPAQFPEKLIEDHIKSWSNEGDIVLDPFLGSGTSGICCKKLNRQFVGIELDEEYYNIAKTRIFGEDSAV